MNVLPAVIILALVSACTNAHQNDELQMPMGYVKYPYQAAYGKDIGSHILISVKATADACLLSDRRLRLFWNNYLC